MRLGWLGRCLCAWVCVWAGGWVGGWVSGCPSDHLCAFARVPVCLSARLPVCPSACLPVCLSPCFCACVYGCVCLHLCVRTCLCVAVCYGSAVLGSRPVLLVSQALLLRSLSRLRLWRPSLRLPSLSSSVRLLVSWALLFLALIPRLRVYGFLVTPCTAALVGWGWGTRRRRVWRRRWGRWG